MEVQNSIFTSNHHHILATSSYLGHQSPPYALLDLLHPPDDDAFPMQQHLSLRFPTPPITPPRHNDLLPPQKRTQSVIMKVGQGRSHVAAEICALDDSQIISHEATRSSESSSSPHSSDYVCDWIDCGRYFESLESLAGHVTQVHAVASPVDSLYYCRWSGCLRTERGFNARYKMLVHVRTHTKEKPHSCHLCDKSFSRAENLKIHIRSHSGEKPYSCTFKGCLKAYSNSSDRFKHTRTHSMDKPYLCKVPGCMKRYTDPSSLRKHVKTFKHSLQLMDTEPISNQALIPASQHKGPAAALDIHSNHHSCCLGRSKEEETPAYLCMRLNTAEASSHSGYYMAIESEDDCHIKVNQMECYYDTDVATRHRNSYQSSFALHRGDFSMDLDTPPLDLRVKRI